MRLVLLIGPLFVQKILSGLFSSLIFCLQKFISIFFFFFFRCYFTNVKTYPVNETWKWIVQVFDTASSNREIVFRSNTQIVNYFNNPFELYSFDTQNTVFIAKIEPKETFYLPLKLVYGKIYFKFFILSMFINYI